MPLAQVAVQFCLGPTAMVSLAVSQSALRCCIKMYLQDSYEWHRHCARNLEDSLNFFQNVYGGDGFWDFNPRRAFWIVRAGFNLNELGYSPRLDLGARVRQALTVTILLERLVKELGLQFRCILRNVLDSLRHFHDELRHFRRVLICRVMHVDQCFGTPLERPLQPDWIPDLYYVDYNTRRPAGALNNVAHEADRP